MMKTIDEIAKNALNVAIASIQDEIGVKTGDVAGVFFSDDIVLYNFKDYITC